MTEHISSIYSKLDNNAKTIRLLHLDPELHPADGRIKCTMVEALLDLYVPKQSPGYYALSYTWGRPDALGLKIWLNGVLKEVRENLWNVLDQFRGSQYGKGLWIDALCINQDDMEERGHQVGFMGEIFRRASCVLIWLGCPKDGPISISLDESEPIYDDETGRTEVLQLLRRDFWDFDGHDKNRLESTHWFQLLWLSNRHYWQRVWIIQEIILADNCLVAFGNDSCTLEDLSHFLVRLLAPGPIPARPRMPPTIDQKIQASAAAKIEAHRLRVARMSREYPMQILSIATNSFCEDPRDKVFGLLGMLDSERHLHPFDVAIDYSRALIELWSDVVRAWIQLAETRQEKSYLIKFSQDLWVSLLGPTEPGSEPREVKYQLSKGHHAQTLSLRYYKIGRIKTVFTCKSKVPTTKIHEHDCTQHKCCSPTIVEQLNQMCVSFVNTRISRWQGPDLPQIRERRTFTCAEDTFDFCLGIAPAIIEDGDSLMRFTGSDIAAICRKDRIICRAIVFEKHQMKEWRAQPDPCEWPPATLDPYIPENFKNATGKSRTIETNEEVLFHLTQPLRTTM